MTEDCYPNPRPKKNEDGYRYSVCTCGHAWHEHDELGVIGFVSMFVYAFTLGHYGGVCSKCECGLFHFWKKLTYEERQRLKPCTEEKQDD